MNRSFNRKTLKGKFNLAMVIIFSLSMTIIGASFFAINSVRALKAWSVFSLEGKYIVESIDLNLSLYLKANDSLIKKNAKKKILNLVEQTNKRYRLIKEGHESTGISKSQLKSNMHLIERSERYWHDRISNKINILFNDESLILEEEIKILQSNINGYIHEIDGSIKVLDKLHEHAVSIMTIVQYIFLFGYALFLITLMRYLPRLIKRIVHISDTMYRVGEGDVDIRLADFADDEIGKVAQFFNYMMDSLGDMKGFLDDVVSSMPSMLIVVDEDLNILRVNEAFFEHMDIKKDNLKIKIHLSEIIYEKIDLSECNKEIELQFKKGEGTLLPVRFISRPLMDKDEDLIGYVCIAQDIKELKIVEKELSEERIRSIHASRLATLGEMASGIAHEVNNPLSIVRAQSTILKKLVQRKKVEEEDFTKRIDEILSTSDRIAKIIQGLRNLSRQDGSREFEKVGLKKIITETLVFCETKLKRKEIKIELNIPDQEIEIYCREVQISQVLLNLISNSMDALLEKNLSDKWIKIVVEDFENEIKIMVIDSGIGISKNIKDKILNPFFTTKKVGKGTGLGLSISRSLIEDHQGSLTILEDSEHTTFVINLPKFQSLTSKAS